MNWVWPGNEYWSCFWSRFYHWAGDSVLPFSVSLSDVIVVKSSWNFVERHEHQATLLPSLLYWEIYPCVWVCLFIRIFISHLHEKHSRTRLQNLTLEFLYLYNFKMLYRRLIFLLGILLSIRSSRRVLYSYFEKVCRKNCACDNPER